MGDHVPDGSDECATDPDLTTRGRRWRRGSGGVHPVDDSQLALTQMPKKYQRGRQTLIRTDFAGGTLDFVACLARRGRWLPYSVGMVITEAIHQHVLKVPASAWTAAVEADGEIRDGAWASELTGDVLPFPFPGSGNAACRVCGRTR
ncbi:hypothetical protein YUWDRAFT_04383 [Streptomyces sp. AmelKG-D3]|nr:hypothetical protein YUWDRAFT_04383 [Streptomyces sp. AmelKG-D3]